MTIKDLIEYVLDSLKNRRFCLAFVPEDDVRDQIKNQCKRDYPNNQYIFIDIKEINGDTNRTKDEIGWYQILLNKYLLKSFDQRCRTDIERILSTENNSTKFKDFLVESLRVLLDSYNENTIMIVDQIESISANESNLSLNEIAQFFGAICETHHSRSNFRLLLLGSSLLSTEKQVIKECHEAINYISKSSSSEQVTSGNKQAIDQSKIDQPKSEHTSHSHRQHPQAITHPANSLPDKPAIHTPFRFSLIYRWFLKTPWRFVGIPLVLIFLSLPIKYILEFQGSPKLQTKTLTIGTLYNAEVQDDLVKHLETTLIPADFLDYIQGKKIDVTVEGSDEISYREVRKHIDSQNWDIVFATSPVLSIYAKDNGYKWIAAMFPGSQTYRSGLFVRADSPIQSIEDIQPTTLIALGEFAESASSFFVPIYDLYGKRLSVSTGHRGSKIVEMVKNDQANIGSAAVSDNRISGEKDLRLISQSREIPGSGVYVSSRLSPPDQEVIQQAMSKSPDEIKEKSNYDVGEEPDYTQFRILIQRVDEILICSDFSKNPVDLYCPEGFEAQVVEGEINGWKSKDNGFILNIKDTTDGSIQHQVYLSREILHEVFSINNPILIVGKVIQTQTPKSTTTIDEYPLIVIKNSSQINILDQ